jgi:hypothetical protein
MVMNYKDLVGSGRGLILRYYPGIRLEGLRKTTKSSISMAGHRGRVSNQGPPEYEAGLLTTGPQRSAAIRPCQGVTCRHMAVRSCEHLHLIKCRTASD